MKDEDEAYMPEIEMNDSIIESAEKLITSEVPSLMKGDLKEIILYGSCARGDYGDESDIDVALLTNCSREEAKKYFPFLAKLAAVIAMENFSVVNFTCIPAKEYEERNEWYPFYRNIRNEGVTIL